jgi:carboxypeptidase T
MKKVLLFILGLVCIAAVQAQERFVARITSPQAVELSGFLKSGYDIAAFSPGQYIDLVIDRQEYQKLLTQGLSLTITQTETQLKENLVAGKSLAGYRTYSDLYAELLSIQAAHPTICKLYDVGDSRGKEYNGAAYTYYKHDIWAMKISDNVETEEDEPGIFYMGEHHAREPIGLEVAMYVLNYIVSNYGIDPAITSSVNNKQIWFMPLVNPDGHKIVTDETDVWWRKNIRDNNNNMILDAGTSDGVDINRNYGWEWGGEGASGVPSDLTYYGPSPFSEPEAMAMKNVLDQHHFVAGITYHSYSELVLFPYAYATDAFAPDHASLQALAVSMANTIPAAGGGFYTPEKSSGLYPASGNTDDYAYGAHGVFCYTIEIGTQFIPPAAQITSICENNLQAALILLNRVDQSALTGIVKDAATLLPLKAQVSVAGIDNTGAYRAPYTSDEGFGRYYRLLPDGNYTVTFSLYGYIPQTFASININNTARTILNVNLLPAQPETVTGTVTDLGTSLPVAGATIQVLYAPVAAVSTNSSGQYTISNLMEGTYDFRISKPGYATIIQQIVVSHLNHVFDFQLQASSAWSFETGAFEPQWTFAGNLPWTITTEAPYDGLYCARSGAIADNQSSQMSIALYLTSGGTVSFFRKVSSETNYDYLRFYIDDVQQGLWSGVLGWGEVSFPVTAGLHTFKWSYTKDAYTTGGSDRAWIDYISFPPTAPVPDPPDIAVTPAMFTKSLTLTSAAADLLNVANNGGLALDYSAQVIYNGGSTSSVTVYPVNASYHTGSTTASAKTQTSLVKGYPTTEAGWMKFDVSAIPDGATINSIEFHGYVNATNYPYWNINPVTSDPVTSAPAVLYNDIIAEASTGYYLYQNETSSYTTGWKVHALGGNANANLQAALLQNWFAIGIMDRDNSSTYYIGFDGWSQVNKPYLVISYTYIPPYSWLTVNGLNTTSGTVQPGTSQDITAGFDAGTLAFGTYNANIKITCNDPVEPQVMIPCTLYVVPLTRSWTGVIDEKWNTAGNWSPAGIPGAEDDVVIPPTAPNMPVVKIQGLSCNNVLVQAGAILIIHPGFILTVNGSITLEE